MISLQKKDEDSNPVGRPNDFIKTLENTDRQTYFTMLKKNKHGYPLKYNSIRNTVRLKIKYSNTMPSTQELKRFHKISSIHDKRNTKLWRIIMVQILKISSYNDSS